MTKIHDAVQYRKANVEDAAGILAVLQEVAAEIPLSLDTPELREAMQGIIAECCSTGESWVAVGSDGTIVGIVLAKPDMLERFFHRNKALSLRYVGVSKNYRRRGIFADLMGKLKAKGVPLTASVLHGNQSGMADRLTAIGYAKVESNEKETRLKWNP
jgi:N-acetylglutamate synthase-like GNAT family acetyltransferase